MPQDDQSRYQGEMKMFVGAYVRGIYWDEEFYPEVVKVVGYDLSLGFNQKTWKNEWKKLVSIVAQEKRKSDYQNLLKEIERHEHLYKERLLENFVEREFNGATYFEKAYIKSLLQKKEDELSWNKTAFGDELEEMLSGGLAGIRKQIFANRYGWPAVKRLFGYIWLWVGGLIEVIILVKLLNLSVSYEVSLVIVCLVLIYLQIRAGMFVATRYYQGAFVWFVKEVTQIRKRLEGVGVSDDGGLRQLERNVQLQMPKVYTNLFYLVIMYLITVLSLLRIVTR